MSRPGSFVGSTYWLKSVFISRCFLPMGFWCRMLENQELEEVITVRVQDPRVQNEGSWNSYVDYKIFLHTNSKAFTAKTSCVRRRYREFVWLRRQLQRNAGLVPVPELPGKSTFFGSSDEFIEKRRQGLQHFLEKVLQSVVLLSDSQLHLFLQSQLSVPEIEACVQGRGSLTVSDAILRYAMSNCGWAQEEKRQSTSHLAKGDQLNRQVYYVVHTGLELTVYQASLQLFVIFLLQTMSSEIPVAAFFQDQAGGTLLLHPSVKRRTT
ncbi:sorting nexin-11 isoform X2 [Peromyscus maniculatus bairdii]|uniref:sorting nexin-11 isoform X2 n=1 Tax=Peromyscus maniculatus bairdii TaxID=230844 RepID=UPI003FD5CB2F